MIESLNHIADKWFAWELAMLWQVAVLIAIIWAVDLLIRKWAWPQVRYALWLLILVKLLLPPTLTSPTSFTAEIASAVQRIVSIQTDQDQNPQDLKPAQVYDIPAAEMPFADMGLEGAQGFSQSEFDPAPAAIAPAIPSAAPIPAAVVRLSWKVYAFIVWLGGMAFLSIWLILRLSGLRREHLKNGQRMPDRFNELVVATAKRLNLRVIPKLILTDKVCCPAVFGVFRPVLLIPAGKLSSMSREDAEHILLHELAHIKRGDLFVHAVYMMIQIAYWFNPPLWLIRRQLQNLRELCCDATVARLLKEKTFSYRETLLKTARQLLAEPVDPGLGLLGLFESSNWLVERLKWLERKTWRNRGLRIATIVLLVAVMAICVLPMARAMSGAPAFTVKGVVTDAETGEPVAGAIVGDAGRYAEGKQSARTDSEGSYNYKTWYEEHEIKCEAPGFKTEHQTLHTKFFGSEKEKVIDFELVSEKVAEQSEFKATLPNGVMVELLGVCEHPSQGKQWWRSDGSILEARPYASIGAKAYHGQPREFAVRLTNLPDERISYRWDFMPAASTAGGDHPEDGSGRDIQDVWAIAAGIKEGIEKVTVRFGVSAGKWQTQVTSEGKGSYTGQGGYGFNFAKPYVEDNHTYVTVSDNMLEFPHRLIAVDKGGNIHEPVDTSSGTAGEIRQSTFGFKNLPVEDVQEFQFQTRPYEWAEFTDVSLRPDKTWRYDLPGPDSLKFGSSSARVVDSRGRGVYGAIVKFGDELTIRDYRNNKTEKWKWNVDDTITDSVGRFPMPSIYIDPKGKTISFNATITADGFLERRDTLGSNYANDNGTIDLFRGMSVEGVVIGPDGQPLGKAPLSLLTVTLYEHPSSGCGGCYDVHTTTEEDGYFRLENVPPGLHLLHYPGRSANCDDPEPLPAQNVSGAAVLKIEDGQDVEGVLIDLSESTCSVTGRIADEKGRPSEGVKASVGVELKITSKDKDGAVVGMSSTNNFHPSELTGPDGVYHIENLPPGDWLIGASYPYVKGRNAKAGPSVKIHLRQGETTNTDLTLERQQFPQQKAAVQVKGAAPEGSKLEFHVVPEKSKDEWPGLSSEEIERYRTNLAEEGPFAGAISGDDYQWVLVDEDLRIASGSIVGQYRDKKYMLLCARAKYSMLPDNTWGLQEVDPRKDNMSRPAVGLKFDANGGELFYKLTTSNIGRHLAIVIDGKVVATPQVNSPVRSNVIITGSFTQAKVEELVRALSKGMPPVACRAMEQDPGFDPVVELTLNDAVAVGKNCLIDFDSGKLFSLPDDWIERPADQARQWFEERGIDASGATRSSVKGLMCEDMIIQPELNDYWDRVASDTLAASNLWEIGRPGIPSYMTAKGALPVTYTFKTREGGIGILQITGFNDDPRGVSIRYKMLANYGNSAVNSQSRSKRKKAINNLPKEVVPIEQVLRGWIESCLAGDVEGVKKAWSDKKSELAVDSLSDINELLGMNPGWEFSLLSVMWDKTEAIAVSGALQKGDLHDGPVIFVWLLEKADDGWKLTDIDLEDLEGLQVENSRFMQTHPQANVWFDNPDWKAPDFGSTVQTEFQKRLDAAKWLEGKAMMGTVASAIRAWVAETRTDGSWTQDELTYKRLGFLPDDFNATYFSAENFSWKVSYHKADNNLTFTITATAGKGITTPASLTLDQDGKLTEQQKPAN